MSQINLKNLPAEVKKHIHQLEQVRRDFVANVSHELRTPLTVIRGYLETLLTKKTGNIENNLKIFNQMYEHSLRMENIIDDLLLLSRLESEDIPTEESDEIPIAEMLEKLSFSAEEFSGDEGHEIVLDLDPELYLRGSEKELKSLFSNLIINAVKYTPPKGIITIAWYRDEKNRAIFKVTDTGIGIAKEHIPRITERFYRVDKARSRESGGTGLGLAIAKHVLLRHHGELAIKSKLGVGSTFICAFLEDRFTIKSQT